jgi:hypothetical protein
MRIGRWSGRFLFQSVSHITSGEMLQLFRLNVNSVHRNAGFGNQVLFPKPM